MKNERKQKRDSDRISADDPNAQEKLQNRLLTLQERQERMKQANAYFKKNKSMKGFAALSHAAAMRMDEEIHRQVGESKPHPSYQLENNRANIRRIKARIAELKNRDALSCGEGRRFPGGSIIINAAENRIQLFFDEKPDERTRAELKSNGFKWSPRKNAWQRQLSENAIRVLDGMDCIQARRDAWSDAEKTEE